MQIFYFYLDNQSTIWYNAYMDETISFRNPSGARYTKQMFLEMNETMATADRSIKPRYTLMHPRHGLPCFRQLYVAFGDPSGYELASRYLEDYNHWELLMRSRWFVEAKEVWDRELDAKLAAEGMAVVRQLAAGGDEIPVSTQLAAARYLADKNFRKSKAPATRGRPSKDEVEGNLKVETQSAKEIAEDLARIRAARA